MVSMVSTLSLTVNPLISSPDQRESQLASPTDKTNNQIFSKLPSNTRSPFIQTAWKMPVPRASCEDKKSQVGLAGDIFRKFYNTARSFLPGSSLICDIYQSLSHIIFPAGKNKDAYKTCVLNVIPVWTTQLCSYAHTVSYSIQVPDSISERTMPENVDESKHIHANYQKKVN